MHELTNHSSLVLAPWSLMPSLACCLFGYHRTRRIIREPASCHLLLWGGVLGNGFIFLQFHDLKVVFLSQVLILTHFKGLH